MDNVRFKILTKIKESLEGIQVPLSRMAREDSEEGTDSGVNIAAKYISLAIESLEEELI